VARCRRCPVCWADADPVVTGAVRCNPVVRGQGVAGCGPDVAQGGSWASRVVDLAVGILRDMGTALVLMLLLFGVFVGIPLWLAWLSATGRFARVEQVMGAEPWHRQSSRWAWVWPLAGAAIYAVMGVVLLAQGHRVLGVANLVTGAFWGLQLPVMVWIKRRQAAQGKTE
jgi:hypothetical protein